jgi:predicted DsbA family dithiol-disulfide isomerase
VYFVLCFATPHFNTTVKRYYFVDGYALNDRPRLAKVAAETLAQTLATAENNSAPPMTEEEILAFLNGNEGRKEIENAIHALHELGVHGIPKFIIEGSSVVDGAALPKTFVRIFREIEERGEVKGPVFGDILGLDQNLIMKASHTPKTLAA